MNDLKFFVRFVLHCVGVTIYASLVLALLWAIFAVEPGKGWSWPT